MSKEIEKANELINLILSNTARLANLNFNAKSSSGKDEPILKKYLISEIETAEKNLKNILIIADSAIPLAKIAARFGQLAINEKTINTELSKLYENISDSHFCALTILLKTYFKDEMKIKMQFWHAF